jgi:hypothetical protein
MSEMMPEYPPLPDETRMVVIVHRICTWCKDDWAPGRPTEALCSSPLDGVLIPASIAQQECVVCFELLTFHKCGHHL